MKQEIKNNELQECQTYVPPRVKVINVTAQSLMCTSPSNVIDPWGGSEEDI